jgi:hypothetical protein
MNEAQKQSLFRVLEETSATITNRLINHNLTSSGVITLEEALFLQSITKEIITEAAEDFIPEIDSYEQDSFIQDNMILKDNDGNEYMYHPDTGKLESVSNNPEEISTGALPDIDGALSESKIIASKLLKNY